MVGWQMKNAIIGYIWECPICTRKGKQAVRCEYTARRHGVMHMAQMHQGSDLPPIIKEYSLLRKQAPREKLVKTKQKKSDIWFEIEHLPAFNIPPINKLLLPHHIFVTKKIYKKIQRQEA